MSGGFTPGPWVVTVAKGGWFEVCIPDEDSRTGGDLVAEVFSPGTGPKPDAEDEANARLIAAAPEMFEALTNLLKTHKGGEELVSGQCCSLADAAIAALAKARGQ